MADEDLSPDLEDLKAEIEKSAGVDEEVKDSVPTTDAVPGDKETKDSKGAAPRTATRSRLGRRNPSAGTSTSSGSIAVCAEGSVVTPPGSTAAAAAASRGSQQAR